VVGSYESGKESFGAKFINQLSDYQLLSIDSSSCS